MKLRLTPVPWTPTQNREAEPIVREDERPRIQSTEPVDHSCAEEATLYGAHRMATVLIVEDDSLMAELVRTGLAARGHRVIVSNSAEAAFEQVLHNPVDLVLTDLQMPGMNGVELCERVAANRPNVPVVVMTAYGSLDTAIAALRAGAWDFVTKPFDVRQLAHAVERALDSRFLKEEVRRLRQAMADRPPPSGLLGSSPAMARVRSLVDRVAPTDTSVLVCGESGTGKELVAQALHDGSPRRNGPFVALNCAAVPDALLESELFGHARGAFTDARTARAGLFAEAHGGTIFLDEVAEMPLALQPKLLRALQERSVRPLGARSEIAFDVRIVAATNRDLATAVREGRFRSDLYYRLNVISIDLPPLRARGNDVLLLAQHFVEHFATRSRKKVDGLLSTTAQKLLAYDWPGNVRELQNCIERAVTLTNTDRLAVEDLPEHIQNYRSSSNADEQVPTELLTLEEVERRHIRRVLEAVGGSKTMAAKTLGVDRTTLYRRLAQMEPSDGRD